MGNVPVWIKKADCTSKGTSRKKGTEAGKSTAVKIRGIQRVDEYGIIAPQDTFGADPFGQTAEERDQDILLARKMRFYVPTVRSQGELEIVRVIPEQIQLLFERSWILGPEDDAVYCIGRQRNAADLMKVYGISDQDGPFLKTAAQPFCIPCGKIRPSAGTDDHDRASVDKTE